MPIETRPCTLGNLYSYTEQNIGPSVSFKMGCSVHVTNVIAKFIMVSGRNSIMSCPKMLSYPFLLLLLMSSLCFCGLPISEPLCQADVGTASLHVVSPPCPIPLCTTTPSPRCHGDCFRNKVKPRVSGVTSTFHEVWGWGWRKVFS